MTTQTPSAAGAAGGATERVRTDVISAVAEATGVDPTDLPPLYHAVEPDALDQLVGPHRVEQDLTVSFQWAGHCVVVDGAGDVTVDPDGSSGRGE